MVASHSTLRACLHSVRESSPECGHLSIVLSDFKDEAVIALQAERSVLKCAGLAGLAIHRCVVHAGRCREKANCLSVIGAGGVRTATGLCGTEH